MWPEIKFNCRFALIRAVSPAISLAVFLPPLGEKAASLRILILSSHYLTLILRDLLAHIHTYLSVNH